jgi:YD repeat-containing protein
LVGIDRVHLTYDVANRLTKLTTPDGTSDYSYNKRDELTATNHSNQIDESYSYDDAGNRTNAGYVIGEQNRLLSDGSCVCIQRQYQRGCSPLYTAFIFESSAARSHPLLKTLNETQTSRIFYKIASHRTLRLAVHSDD